MKHGGTGKQGKEKRRLSLRFQLVAILLLCYLIPALTLGIFAGSVLLRGIRNNIDSALQSGALHAWTMTIGNIDRTVALAKETVYDEDLALFRSQWRSASISNAEYLRLSRNYLERKFGRESLFTFALFVPADSGDLVICNPSGRGAAADLISSGLQSVLNRAESLDTSDLFIGNGETLTLVRNILDLRMEPAGTLVLGINRDELFQPVLGLGAQWDGEVSILLDQYGDGDSMRNDLPEGLNDLPRERKIVFVRTSAPDSGYDLRLLLTLEREKQYSELYRFQRLSVLLILVLVPLLALIILFVRRRIIRPIGILADASRRIEAGELGVTVPMHGGDELGDLGAAFSQMSLRLKDLIEKTYQSELSLKDARIQALQSRINPHFLNNALETINWQARMEGSETITGMVSSLSVLLNASLDKGNRRLVPLKEELEVAEGYIFFIRQRYDDLLTVRRDIGEDAGACMIPLLTLQPVLENAVEHGIAPAGGGKITLSAVREDAGLKIRITNTGKPIGPEDRERIVNALSGNAPETAHIGLANIARRLRLLYGSRAAISVESGPEGETVAEILVPQDPIPEGEKE